MESTLGIGLNSFGGGNDNDGGGIVIVVGGADSYEPDGGDARADEGQGRLRPNSESIKLKGKYPSGASGSGSETEFKWLAPLFRFKLLLGHTLDEWGWLIIITGYVHEPLIRTRGVRSVLK